jgi:FMN phosphatase YigB (HAD superfamily)
MSHTNYSNIKVIGFDLDQTLYPKSPEIDEAIQGYIYEKISKKLSVDLAEAKIKFDNLYQKGRGLSGSKTLISLGFETDIAKNIVQEALENAPIAKFLRPDQETIHLLEKIKNNYPSIDLITGSNKTNAMTKLEKLEVSEKLFSHIITANDASKSDSSAFHLWLSFYPDLKPENFLYVGDRISSDFEKPKEVGIQSILVNIQTPDQTVDCPQLPSLLEIPKYLL